MSLLPSFAQKTIVEQTAEQQEVSLSLFEYGVNFNNGQLTGMLVNGSEAVKVWIWKCLMTERFRYPIYSWMYGSELERYIGQALPQEYIDTDVRLGLEDALLINPEITSITDFRGSLEHDVLTISFTANTIYGAVSILDYKINTIKTPFDRAIEVFTIKVNNGTFKFSIENSELVCHTNDVIENILQFNVDDFGNLIASAPEELFDVANFEIDENTGILKAEYDV